MKPKLEPKISILVLLGAVCVLTGCRTIDTTAASKFAAGVVSVKSQADVALTAAASLTRAESVTYAAIQPQLAENNFSETPTTDVIVAWDDALSSIESYALNLAALSSPNATASFDAAATNLFNQFTQTAAQLKASSFSSSPQLTAGLASAFAETARLILQAQAQATARKVAESADPKIQEILHLLADEVGPDHEGPWLRTTIYRVWNTEKDDLSDLFLKAADQKAKEAIAEQYSSILANRAAEDQSLASLRKTLLSLADAHHALAQGNDVSVEAAMTFSANELQRTRDLYTQFATDLKPKK